jgi:hypothetical protein
MNFVPAETQEKGTETDEKWCVQGLPKWMTQKKFDQLLNAAHVPCKKTKKVVGNQFGYVTFEVFAHSILFLSDSRTLKLVNNSCHSFNNIKWMENHFGLQEHQKDRLPTKKQTLKRNKGLKETPRMLSCPFKTLFHLFGSIINELAVALITFEGSIRNSAPKQVRKHKEGLEAGYQEDKTGE